jgi:GT2 family glycosyltransferase
MDVQALTVSYGERAHLLEPVIDAVLAEGVRRVLIVDNGMGPQARDWLATRVKELPEALASLRLESPGGPAVGFSRGLDEIRRSSAGEWIWILDDDNRPEPGALAALLAARGTEDPARTMWSSARLDRAEHRALLAGRPPSELFPRRSSLLGFHWKELPGKIARTRKDAVASADPAAVIQVPWGPFGGLFFHRSLLASGLEIDPSFHLYGDDLDLTLRHSTSGGTLYLVPGSRLQDLEPSWHVAAKGRTQFERLLRTERPERAYYLVRNNAFLDSARREPQRASLLLNRLLFTAILTMTAVRLGKLRRLPLFLRALRRGFSGQLGDETAYLNSRGGGR